MRTAPEKQLKNYLHEHAKPENNNWNITERKGHHTPNSQRYGYTCGCEPTTPNGNAYRDKVAKATNPENTKWNKIRFYHQAPVVKKLDDVIEVDGYGHIDHNTTRERINQELPKGFKLVQRDFEVKLQVPNGDNIELPTEKFRIDKLEQSIRKTENKELICHYEA